MSTTQTVKSHDEIRAWMTNEVAKILDIEADAVDTDQEFFSFGIDSIVAFSVIGDLCEWIDKELPATLLWEYPTINKLSQHISEQLDKGALPEYQPYVTQ